MDFSEWKNKIVQGTKKFQETVQTFSDKTLAFAEENIVKTSLFLQTDEDFQKAIEEKRSVIFAFDEKSEFTKEIMLLLPIWQSKVFMDVAKLCYLNNEKSERLIHEKGFNLPIEMRVYFQGELKFTFNDFNEIKAWWNGDRDYEKNPEQSVESEQTSKEEKTSLSDPLSN